MRRIAALSLLLALTTPAHADQTPGSTARVGTGNEPGELYLVIEGPAAAQIFAHMRQSKQTGSGPYGTIRSGPSIGCRRQACDVRVARGGAVVLPRMLPEGGHAAYFPHNPSAEGAASAVPDKANAKQLVITVGGLAGWALALQTDGVKKSPFACQASYSMGSKAGWTCRMTVDAQGRLR